MASRIKRAGNSVKVKKPRGKGRPFTAGNPWAFKPGQSGNPNGRPKLLSEAYRDVLAYADDQGISNAAKVAYALADLAVSGDISAAKELRQTTEGDKITVDLSKLSDEQLSRLAAGESLRAVLADPGQGGAGETPAAEGPPDP